MCSNSVSCPLCYHSSFPNIDTLRISLIKAANGPISCPICNDILLGLDKLTIHLFSHTNLLLSASNAGLPAICGGQSSARPQSTQQPQPIVISTSTVVENGGSAPTIAIQDSCVSPIKCDICGLTFRSADLLRMHNKLIHRIPDDVLSTTTTDIRYQCHLCAKIFKMKGSLRVHLKVVHLIGLPSSKDSPKLNICQKIKNKSIQGPSPTSSIAKTPPSPPAVKRSETQTGNECAPAIVIAAEAPKPIASDVSPKSLESSKIWECDICSKSFTTKYFLKKHKRLHTGEMPYTCSICGKTFTFQQSYHKHLLYHSDEKPHACQTCGRAFKELSTLHNHERIHSGEKPFKCETCGKCFRQRVSYLVHKRIHTGAMPYKCTACEKSFRYKVSQRTHKCTAQPPGMVVRQSGDLLERLLQSTSILSSKSDEEDASVGELMSEEQTIPETLHGAELIRADTNDEDLLIKSIDEIVSESCNKMGIESIPEVEDLLKIITKEENADSNGRTPSPSVKFENLCLYSPCDSALMSQLDVIGDDSFKLLLQETS